MVPHDLAALLARRDADGDDRRMCCECSHLEKAGRCALARAGKLKGATRELEPVRYLLQRCSGFRLCGGALVGGDKWAGGG